MQQPNKAVISPGLRGLMLVQQGLKELQGQGGVPAAGGLPTVLDQAKQAATQALGAQAPQQQVQPSMTPPLQGPQAPEGGIAGIAQNAATGANINDMKQKQAEQAMMQMAQQQTQQPQMMASGGIAKLPAGNMQFSEGGIIPYANGGGIDLSGVQYGAGMAPVGIEGALAPTPALEESPEIATIRAKQREIEALNRGRPDFYKQNIAALEADKAARDKAAAEQQKRQGFDAFMALVGSEGGIGGMGRASTQLDKVQSERKDAARQANLLDAQMRIKLGELEYARQIGDVTNAMKTEADIAGLKRQMEVNAINRAQVTESGRGRVTTAETAANRLRQEAEQAAVDQKIRMSEQASRERIAGLGLGRQEDKANREEFKIGLAASGIPKRIAELGPVKHLPKHKIEYDAAVKQLDDLAKLYNVPSDFARILADVGSEGASAAPPASGTLPGYKVIGLTPQK